jgi:hypothetical protein
VIQSIGYYDIDSMGKRCVEEEKMESVMRDNMQDGKTTPISHSQLSSV